MPDTPNVTLREITADTVGAVIRLSVAESQKGFVATNAVSLAQALFAPEAWYRAIYRGEERPQADDIRRSPPEGVSELGSVPAFAQEPVGFVMLYDESLRVPPPVQPKVGVWRLMIDEKFQGRGIGRAAVQQVIAHVRSKALFATLELSYVPGPGCPEPFYRGLGFRPTDRMDGIEVVLEIPLGREV